MAISCRVEKSLQEGADDELEEFKEPGHRPTHAAHHQQRPEFANGSDPQLILLIISARRVSTSLILL